MKADLESVWGVDNAYRHLLARVSEFVAEHAVGTAASGFRQVCAAAADSERSRAAGRPDTSAATCSFDLAELTDAELREERLAARNMRDNCARESRPEASLFAELVHLIENEWHRRRRSRQRSASLSITFR